MPIKNIELGRLVEADLLSLVENEVAEGIDLEYKQEAYGGTDSERKEFLKDVSSLANTAGGDLIVGMKEDGGVATDLIGVDANIDIEQQRLESLLRDRVEPRIIGIRMRPIPLASGRRALVIRIPKSWNPPHAVTQNKSRLIFARNSAGAHESSIDEMRAMFTSGATLLDRARNFHDRRIEAIHNGVGPLSNLVHPGRLVLHVIPFSAFGANSAVDLKIIHQEYLPPIWFNVGHRRGYNLHGCWTTSHHEPLSGYVQVFRNGIIESAAADVREELQQGGILYTDRAENEITTKLESYLSAMARAEVSPPILVMVGGVRMAQTRVIAHPYPSPGAQPLPGEPITFPTIMVENYGRIEDYRQLLKPIFDAVWNAAGFEGSLSYSPGGRWNAAK